MTKSHGILIVSHVQQIAEGLVTLLSEVAFDVSIKYAGGTADGKVGTSFERIEAELAAFEEDNILAFYDLGSAKMNLELAIETSTKDVTLLDTALIESSYTAAALLQADAPFEAIREQLQALKIK